MFSQLNYIPLLRCFLLAHALEQYFTSSQTLRHFFRQLNGRWQTGQTLVGRSDFLIILM